MDEFEPKVIWLFGFIAVYWAYCLFCAANGARSARSASDYFIAGRGLGSWVFVLAATATAFSGWTFIGHPGLIYRDGFPYAFASFYAIAIPLTGVLFLKRQWMLGKRFGFVTPGELYSEYFRSDTMRWLVLLVAIMFTIPILGIQLRASGFLLNALSDGLLPINMVMWVLAGFIYLYVALGGLRGVAYAEMLQCILVGAGIVALGLLTIYWIGGFDQFTQGLAALAEIDEKRTPDGYSHYVAIPGVIQFVRDGQSAIGGPWTATMILTYMIAVMGIQAAPAFTMWAFASRSPAPFAPQQVWASAFVAGGILIIFSAILGLGGHFLGADTMLAQSADGDLYVNDLLGQALLGNDLSEIEGRQEMLVPQLINLLTDVAPWAVALLGVCALAAMQSTGAAYMSTFAGMLTRDIFKAYIMPRASHRLQIAAGRFCALLVLLASLAVATYTNDYLVLMGGLAVAFALQLFPALLGICYLPWFTRMGVSVGIVLGLIVVILTERVGVNAAVAVGFELPWGRWPLTMHSAFWGLAVNVVTTVFVSAATQTRAGTRHRMVYHDVLQEYAAVPAAKRKLIPLAWIVVLLWFFFAVGPGAVFGNTAFGDPNDAATWQFGIPSIWAWQIIGWFAGVLMMYLLAYGLSLSTVPERQVEALIDDIGDRLPPEYVSPELADSLRGHRPVRGEAEEPAH